MEERIWYLVSNLIFQRWWLPERLRPVILRAFGAKVGKRVSIRQQVRIRRPWRLEIGDDCWIAQGAWFQTLSEMITLEDDVCVSHDAMIFGGYRQANTVALELASGNTLLEHGAWIGAKSIVMGGVTIGRNRTVPAGGVARESLEGKELTR
jgi:putative colanic acid biosynthesis acetyltransferase WcaF